MLSKKAFIFVTFVIRALVALGVTSFFASSLMAATIANGNPHLVINQDDVQQMRTAIKSPGLFQTEYLLKKSQLDAQLERPQQVPTPKDAGGGYTHEVHKNNAQSAYDAGIVYQLSGDEKYAIYVRDMLLKYAQLYPTLPLHPERKTDSVISAGKLFWQNLNESVWLVYSIQAYDAVLPSLTLEERNKIESGLFRPIVQFLSEDSPETFNKIHNHATWATCAVGMAGYVLGEQEWVEKALLGLDKSGKGGFLLQLNELFSPQGYYNEGPYYQRYALLPFVTFAKAIQVNEPQRKIFNYRDSIILKAINATIQLSYNKLFFPINDAIKDKGIDTIELVNGVAIAYGITADPALLDIATLQNTTLLTGDGLKVAKALDDGLVRPYQFKSMAFGDGAKGDQGALVVMRDADQALVYKATAQGMGHGHFDKLNWLFFDNGEEIVSDYGAARFLNVEAKFGGRYLPENNTYANQTVAHNTLVVDETSHFQGNTEKGNAQYPEFLYFEESEKIKISAARMSTAYKDVTFVRTMAQLRLSGLAQPIVVDLLSVKAKAEHQLDLPLHYKGHLVDTNFPLNTERENLRPLGKKNGYQHLWLKARGAPSKPLAQITWLNENGRFYSLSTLVNDKSEILFTQIGANDPHFNLRTENAFIVRIPRSKNYDFVSVLEPHGEYNPVKEFTLGSESQVNNITSDYQGKVQLITIQLAGERDVLLAVNNDLSPYEKQTSNFSFRGVGYSFDGHFTLIELDKK